MGGAHTEEGQQQWGSHRGGPNRVGLTQRTQLKLYPQATCIGHKVGMCTLEHTMYMYSTCVLSYPFSGAGSAKAILR